jgi:mono/diheme cytochrome c family protein
MRVLLIVLMVAGLSTAARSQFVDITPTLVQPSMSGRDIFRYYCVSCHGRDGRGDGPVASALSTRPANLRLLSARNGGTFPLARVRGFITQGTPTAAHGTPDMPVWGPIFQSLDGTDERARARIENVVAYLMSMQVK